MSPATVRQWMIDNLVRLSAHCYGGYNAKWLADDAGYELGLGVGEYDFAPAWVEELAIDVCRKETRDGVLD